MRALASPILNSARDTLSIRIAVALAGFLLTFCWPAEATVMGQDDVVTEKTWRKGFHGFKVVAEGSGLKFADLESWKRLPSDQKLLVAIGSLSDLPIDLRETYRDGIPTLVITEGNDVESLAWLGVRVIQGPPNVWSSRDMHRFQDCPMMVPGQSRVAQSHPIFNQVDAIVANRASYFASNSANTRSLIYLPRMQSTFNRIPRTFVFTVEDPTGGRLVAVADTSLFTNQMLLVKRNLEFTENLFRWLQSDSGESRSMLMLVDGQVQTSVDPSQIVVLPPPPSREEVLNAIQNLPPEAMLEFGNSVVQVAEDENMLNDFLSKLSDDFNPRKVTRFLILLAFATATLVGMVTYFWQKKLLRKTASDVALQRQRVFEKRSKVRLAEERKLAASILLNNFCLELANRRIEDWPMFPQGLQVGTSPAATLVLNQMTDAHQALRSGGRLYWTSERLSELMEAIEHWRSFLAEQQSFEIDVPPAASQT